MPSELVRMKCQQLAGESTADQSRQHASNGQDKEVFIALCLSQSVCCLGGQLLFNTSLAWKLIIVFGYTVSNSVFYIDRSFQYVHCRKKSQYIELLQMFLTTDI